MKSIVEKINENLINEGLSVNDKAHVMDHSLIDAFKYMEEKGWTRDENYNNWTAGESIFFKFTKGSQKVYLEAYDKRELYDGDNLDDIMDKLKISDIEN